MKEFDKKLLYGALILLALSFALLLTYYFMDLGKSISRIYEMKNAAEASFIMPVRFDKEYISEVCRYI